MLALVLKKEKNEYAILLAIGTIGIIFYFALDKLMYIVNFFYELVVQLPIEVRYISQLLKMLGISYVAEFSSAICKDAGYEAISGQIDLFAKLSILALGIPILSYLIEVVEAFL